MAQLLPPRRRAYHLLILLAAPHQAPEVLRRCCPWGLVLTLWERPVLCLPLPTWERSQYTFELPHGPHFVVVVYPSAPFHEGNHVFLHVLVAELR